MNIIEKTKMEANNFTATFESEPNYYDDYGFSKIPFKEFKNTMSDIMENSVWEEMAEENTETIEEIYNNIKIPQRATQDSCGYDFFSTLTFSLLPGEEMLVPTGIRAKIPQNTVLMIFPRSGLGFKYRMQLNNTVGIIDSDYYYSDNFGHIMIKITTNKQITIKRNSSFCQGIILPFYKFSNEITPTKQRNGGFGSTSK